jgi:hypothetical protein
MESENNTPVEEPKPSKPASQRIPGILIRLVLVLVAGCLIGAVIYFAAAGWIPYFEQRIFQPIDQNQSEIRELLTVQAELKDQIDSMSGTMTALEAGSANTLQEAAAEISSQLDSMQNTIENNTYFAATLNPGMVATVSAKLDSTNRNLSALATAQMRNAGLDQEINLLRVLELFSQANMHILHNNYGLAAEQLETSREILEEMVIKVPPARRVVILEMIRLLESGLNDLPARPSLAAEKLGLAWQMGITDFSDADQPPSKTITPTNYPGAGNDPSPTPN